MGTVILAYSGGLDTSVALTWPHEHVNLKVADVAAVNLASSQLLLGGVPTERMTRLAAGQTATADGDEKVANA